MVINSKMTRDEANDIVNGIIQAGWEVDMKYAEEYNLNLDESLSIGRRHRARLLSLLDENFEVEDC